jgi:hypothetical protein
MSGLARRPQLSGPLASRNFRLLAACNVISRTGSAIAFVAIPFAVLRAGGSAADIGYVATAELLPRSADRRWSRPDIIEEMAAEQHPDSQQAVAEVSDLTGTRLAADVVLVTYVSQRGSRRCRRSSV